jgi:hypothetical protein
MGTSSGPIDLQQLGKGTLTPSQYSPYNTPIFRPEVEQGLKENKLVIVEDAYGKQLGTIENDPRAIEAYMRDYPGNVVRRPSQPNLQMPPMGRTGATSQQQPSPPSDYAANAARLKQQQMQQEDNGLRTPDGTPSVLGPPGTGLQDFIPATNGIMFPQDIQEQLTRGERVIVKKGDRVIGTIPNRVSSILREGGRGFNVMGAAGNRSPEDR